MQMKKVAGVVGVSSLALVAGLAMAAANNANTDTTFAPIVTLLENWAGGTLGKVLAMAIFVVGIAAGVVRQSVMAAVAGIAGALVLGYGPSVIDNIFTALI